MSRKCSLGAVSKYFVGGDSVRTIGVSVAEGVDMQATRDAVAETLRVRHGIGASDSDDFSMHSVGSKPGRERVTTGAHIAFRAPDADAVRRWHEAALRNGGTDNGPPGTRPEYSGNYYAAFVRDPDGNRLEAVTRRPEEKP